MVASCYRRSENYQKALKLYEEIYNDYPENMECLRFLVQICQELGLPYEQYNAEYMRQKRKQEAEDAKFSDFQNIGDDYLNGGMGQAPDNGMKQGGQGGPGFDAPPMMGGVDLGGPTRYFFFNIQKLLVLFLIFFLFFGFLYFYRKSNPNLTIFAKFVDF